MVQHTSIGSRTVRCAVKVVTDAVARSGLVGAFVCELPVCNLRKPARHICRSSVRVTGEKGRECSSRVCAFVQVAVGEALCATDLQGKMCSSYAGG